MTDTLILVDTNILCYALDSGDQKKQEVAAGLLSRCWLSEITLAVSIQNLAEFSVVMKEKIQYPLPDEVVTRFIRDIVLFEGWRVIGDNPEIIIDAVRIRQEFSLHFWDALLVATMKHHNIDAIYTEDVHFQKVSWVTVINPFSNE